MKTFLSTQSVRSALPAASLLPLVVALSGCLGDSSNNDDGPTARTGTFVDSAVAGLDYAAASHQGMTNASGEFSYAEGESISFSIGDLALGSAVGQEVLTPLNIVDGAASAEDQRVTNMLVLLQSLDSDGNLNNGIDISEAIRDEISASAGSLSLDQSTADFSANLTPVLDRLEAQGSFVDTDPRPRKAVATADALEHFSRSTSPRNVVTTTGGDLSGFEADQNTWQYLGVPYAKPPLGDLRWRAPVPADPWEGVRDATSWRDQAAQNPALERFGEGGMSEDSLYLNVTAPKQAEDLPVMVWFHGGGFTSLTSNTKPFNNPAAVASKGVVQVSVNHRLGPFGYIAHPELSAESGYGGSGNYGQMDLIMALRWVQDNIAEFGGDPSNVTIFGESGGGRKVLSLMASPEAAGLFHRAISQSGTLYPDTRSLAAAEGIGSDLQARLNAASLEEMREKSWLEVVSAAATITPYTNVDNFYLPTTERTSFETDTDNDVPFMFTVNTNDTIDPINTVRDVFPWMVDYISEPTFATLFSHQPAGWKARGVQAYHGAELAYMFNMPTSVITHYQLGLVIDPATGKSLQIGDLNGNGVSGSAGDPADIFASAGFDETDDEVIDRMLTIWTNFAKTGNPSVEGDIQYPIYNAQTQEYVDLSDTAEAKADIAAEFPVE
ncbi:carboxylesterase family protein [Halopseudomonas nanhaiensis]|uniref:carboxylesterase/lipase family protein n=1 Tax=Halopseudomonas nanhaiensis TaxID=2830842 RepID=UPI001CBAB77C|nr:carboxylesterase family protein [Halopseudomonas nanhaiensis]UAW97203.1 carboxylesterase family protein [Halopseudomonas nanhaiensis]